MSDASYHPPTPEELAEASAGRLSSLDAYRGFVMVALASAGFGLAQVAEHFPHSYWSGDSDWQWPDTIWYGLARQFQHVTWTGGVFWDLIQPAFIFVVGVAIPYATARRRARGESFWRGLGRALLRSLLLIVLGVFLKTQTSPTLQVSLVNVLTQIGLGYTFVYLLMGRGWIVQLLALVAILGGYWWLFYQYAVPMPVDAASFRAAYNLPPDYEPLTGLFAHWNMNVNFATHFDQWLLNLFPPHNFTYDRGGYQTLNFVPSMGTMLMGLMAGELLRTTLPPRVKLQRIVAAGILCVTIGYIAGFTVCPIVKRIWTPSFTLVSGAATLWMLAAFYGLIEVRGWRRWAWPLMIVGMNSLAMYVMSQLMRGWVAAELRLFFGPDVFAGVYGSLYESLAILAVLWMICWWLYQKKIFVRL